MKKLKIAVVGSGISGLSCSWLLSKAHDVTLFEAENRLGGHSHTVDVGNVPIDVGFIVFNEKTYPNLTALLRHLDVPTTDTAMGFSVSLDEGRFEYSGGSLAGLFGSPRLAMSQSHWRMLGDITRFYRSAKALSQGIGDDVTLEQFLAANNFSEVFIKRHLVPMASAIWSSKPDQMLDYPAKAFIDFFDNHQLLKLGARDNWKTVSGGSICYVNKIISSGIAVRKGDAVVQVLRDDEGGTGGVTVKLASGMVAQFDHVVLACHADQALAMLARPRGDEVDLLGRFHYSNNRVVLHRDPKLMPAGRRHWSSWNYVGSPESDACGVTYWMNALQSLPTDTQHFVSLNPARTADIASVDTEINCTHPIFTPKTLQAQKSLWQLQGVNRTWFCGSYFGAGFHEDGLQAGLAVAEQLGGVARPWTVARPSGRIHLAGAASNQIAAE